MDALGLPFAAAVVTAVVLAIVLRAAVTGGRGVRQEPRRDDDNLVTDFIAERRAADARARAAAQRVAQRRDAAYSTSNKNEPRAVVAAEAHGSQEVTP